MNIKNYTHMYLYCITGDLDDNLKKIKIMKAQSIALSEDIHYPGGWRRQTMLKAHHNQVIWFNFLYFGIWRPSVIYCTDVRIIYDGTISFSHAIYNSAKNLKWKTRCLKLLFLYQQSVNLQIQKHGGHH